jgi:site-specific recombinase XerD
MIMFFTPVDRLFDTIRDTKNLLVSNRAYFRIRKKTDPTRAKIILHLTRRNDERQRIDIDIEINTSDWIDKEQRLIPNCQNNTDINMILQAKKADINNVMINYRLSRKELSNYQLKVELENSLTRISFLAFFEHALEENKVHFGKGTYKRYESVLTKLRSFRKSISFDDLNEKFFNDYRHWCIEKSNAPTTINGNIIVIKNFLAIAVKTGIKLNFNLDDIRGGSTHGNRNYLTPTELKNLFTFYQSKYITDSEKIILGTFLFGCMTGWRISDLQKANRLELLQKERSFVNTKSGVNQFSLLNGTAQIILDQCELLFVAKFSDVELNRGIKKIALKCKIEKSISMHVARHTFATCFLRPEVGGTVHHLQKLLKHKNITTTMVYAHIIESEANEMVFYLDKLFK